MAVEKIVRIKDDFSGEEGASNHVIAIDGVEFSIDLTDASLAHVLGKLTPYLTCGRRIVTLRPSPQWAVDIDCPTINKEDQKRHVAAIYDAVPAAVVKAEVFKTADDTPLRSGVSPSVTAIPAAKPMPFTPTTFNEGNNKRTGINDWWRRNKDVLQLPDVKPGRTPQFIADAFDRYNGGDVISSELHEVDKQRINGYENNTAGV